MKGKQKKTPAQESAERSLKAQKQNEDAYAKQQEERAARHADERARALGMAQERLPALLKDWRAKIAEAESRGACSCRVDERRVEEKYYDKEQRTEQQRLEKLALSESRNMAKATLEQEGYKVVFDSRSRDTEWGAGSDPLATAGETHSWIDISW